MVTDIDQLLSDVKQRIDEDALTLAEAATQIGVTSTTLSRHLGGSYVRSDSAAKYRQWLFHNPKVKETSSKAEKAPIKNDAKTKKSDDLTLPPKPQSRHRVVDLFSGCGGLSLGFDLVGEGDYFETVLAIDIEEAMVRVFNANHSYDELSPIGRQADLAEFLNEAEVLAYYLDHIASLEQDENLYNQLNNLEPLGLRGLVQKIQSFDDQFVDELRMYRQDESYQKAYSVVPKNALSQTSVLGFHRALKLPVPRANSVKFEPPLWGKVRGFDFEEDELVHDHAFVFDEELLERCRENAEALWKSEIFKLQQRAEGSGSGQLASASQKISDALELLDGENYEDTRQSWLDWRTKRDALRIQIFTDDAVLAQLRSIYNSGYAANVLLGGPPCQGFSRIGRGKIRSLREQSVHVQTDSKAGDSRNELMHQYVLFVAALSPRIFLFENVRHFKTEVQTPEGTFNATDILAEAIQNISHDGLEYAVSSRIIDASKHLVPQTRERFFMVGIRQDVTFSEDAARWCLDLPERPTVPLKTALMGLPKPVFASKTSHRPGGTETLLAIEKINIESEGSSKDYLEWVRKCGLQQLDVDNTQIDSHCTRDSRQDDRDFFQLLGPGKRWMDYRCDDNHLVSDLALILDWVLESGNQDLPLSKERLKTIRSSMDGSLSIRLLLDTIELPPGEIRHHLASKSYLKKRDGSHGDWLARLDAEVPCKTMVSHMGKDTYAYVHPLEDRTLSVREAARVQSFPDWYSFGSVGLVDGYRVVGNAVPPLLASQLATRIASMLDKPEQRLDKHKNSQALKLQATLF